MKILIRGGRLIDPASGRDEVGDLAIVNTPAGEASWYVNEIEYVK